MWHEALEPQTTNITPNRSKMYSKSLPTRVYTKASRSRPKQAYANAYATYAVCMGAYMSCGIPPYFSASRRKKRWLSLAQMRSTMGQSLIIFASSPTKSTERCAPALRVPTCLRPNTCATPLRHGFEWCWTDVVVMKRLELTLGTVWDVGYLMTLSHSVQ